MAKLMFVQNVWHECAGLMSISAVLKKNGHETAAAIGREPRDFYADIEKEKPDVVGVPVLIGSQEWALRVSSDLKKRYGVKIMFGNLYATLFPGIMDENGFVDYICRGEGETPVLRLMDGIRDNDVRSDIPNMWIRKNGAIHKNEIGPMEDLDQLPFYDRELYSKYDFFRMLPMVVPVDRYCPGNCTFCYEPVLKELYKGKGKFYRKRDPELVIKELQVIKDKYYMKTRKNPLITFGSDNINADREWFRRFFRMYREQIGFPYFCGITAAFVDEEQASLLKASNCYMAAFGLESGNERIRQQVLKKGLRTEQILEAGRLLNKYKVDFYTGNMFGIPGETTAEALETVELNIKIKPTTVVAFILQPYPGTAIERYAIDNSYMPGSDADRFLKTMHRESLIKQGNIDELLNLHKLFIVAVKAPFLFPLIKRLIKLRPNVFFDMVFLFTHAVLYMKKFHRLSFVSLVKYSWRYFYFFRK
ncbi:MAG: B12-binding domain-containing radical SAM protein [Candidatus Omnitrophica bacterium]|nr:B12-binding domain-containing radical SAM protein [Candidatus Omnitrophota bacterium]